MVYFFAFITLFMVACCAALGVVIWRLSHKLQQQERDTERIFTEAATNINRLNEEAQKLRFQVTRLGKWAGIADADDTAREMVRQAESVLASANLDAQAKRASGELQYTQFVENGKLEASALLRDARAKAKELSESARFNVLAATKQSSDIIAQAHLQAESIAGKAYEVVRNADLFERTARAMKNIIEGYGDEYLKPAESLLDELAEEYRHKEAGRELKLAREHVLSLIQDGHASSCEYVEESRRRGAERFVLDAFNGKVDSILSRVRHDNYGVLEQEIKDAFTVVNYGGKAFRDARITDEYLHARLAELKWGMVAQELRKKDLEEQRQIREAIREEERARREYEKARRDAAKEEDSLRKAMARARAEAEAAIANEEQRAMFESQLAELQQKLQEAEERNQRAISMAQQTRRGHVYVISNVGSFGDGVYKIGMTRRLEPLDRIKELGDASVPFGFDVHAMIMSDDAPALERQLHKEFVLGQVNKINHRKEFYRTTIAEIRQKIDELGIEARWTMAAEARQYHESLAIERAIAEDPTAREQWINRQLVLESLDDAAGLDEADSENEPVEVDELEDASIA